MILKDKKLTSRLNVTETSSVTGLSTHTIRAWEKRHTVVRPIRRGNRRTYSSMDIERLIRLKELVSLGHSIRRASLMTEDEQLRALSLRPPLSIHRDELLALVENYLLEELAEKLRLHHTRLRTQDFLLEIICPLLAEVGHQVEQGRLGIAQEHALSALVRDQISRIRLKEPRAGLPTLAFCTPGGDFHELGILIAARLSAAKGFPVLYFGPNLPSQPLSEILNVRKPEIMIIGAAAISDNLRTFENYLLDATRSTEYPVQFWVAGPLAEKMKGRYRVIRDFKEFDSALSQLEMRT